MKIWKGATPEQTDAIEAALALLPVAFQRVLNDADIRVRPVGKDESIIDASPTMRALEDPPHSAVGLYVLGEKTLYIKSSEPAAIVHELGHAVDHALGMMRGCAGYVSQDTAAIRQAFRVSTKFVSGYAASDLHEFFAEGFRGYVGGQAGEALGFGHRITPKSLEECAPILARFFSRTERQVARDYAVRDARLAAADIARPALPLPDVADRYVAELDDRKNPKWIIRDTLTGDALAEPGSAWPVRTKSETKARQRAADLNALDRGEELPADTSARTTLGKDYRAEMTEQLIAALEAGTAPWQRPWALTRAPYNATRGNEYRGGNRVMLTFAAIKEGFDDPRWITKKQAEDKGYRIAAGERGHVVQYWDFSKSQLAAAPDPQGAEKSEDDESSTSEKPRRRRPTAFYAIVYNAAQIEVPRRDGQNAVLEPPVYDRMPVALPLENRTLEFTPVERAERIITASGVPIKHGGDQAFYLPSADRIQLPARTQFDTVADYYATAMHELGHSTGHSSRLNRDLSGAFGSPAYAREELRAEIASMFMSMEIGIPHDTQRHAPYVANWVQILRDDKNEVFRAATDAQKISDFLIELERARAIEPTEVALNSEVPNLPEGTQIVPRALMPIDMTATVAETTATHVYANLMAGRVIQIDRTLLDGTVPQRGETVHFVRSGDRDTVVQPLSRGEKTLEAAIEQAR